MQIYYKLKNSAKDVIYNQDIVSAKNYLQALEAKAKSKNIQNRYTTLKDVNIELRVLLDNKYKKDKVSSNPKEQDKTPQQVETLKQ